MARKITFQNNKDCAIFADEFICHMIMKKRLYVTINNRQLIHSVHKKFSKVLLKSVVYQVNRILKYYLEAGYLDIPTREGTYYILNKAFDETDQLFGADEQQLKKKKTSTISAKAYRTRMRFQNQKLIMGYVGGIS